LEIINRVGVPRTDPGKLMTRLAVCLMITGRPEQAELIAGQAVDICRATRAADDDEDLIKALTVLGASCRTTAIRAKQWRSCRQHDVSSHTPGTPRF
jgi:hypothetical protein